MEFDKRIQQIKIEIEKSKAVYAKLEGHLEEAMFWQNELLKNDSSANESEKDPEIE